MREKATTLATWSAALTLLLPSLAVAQASQEGVWVVPHGPTRSLERWTIESAGAEPDLTWEATSLGSAPVIAQADPERVIRDARVVASGELLMVYSGADGVATSAQGEATLLLQPESAFSSLESVAVVGYGARKEVRRVVLTDSARATVSIHDIPQARDIWRTSLFVPGARAFMVQGILLPGARVATAANWRSISTSGVDIFELTAQGDMAHRRIASAAHEGAPVDFIEQPALQDVRDLHASDEDTLIVTTRFAILSMELDGRINWRIDLSEDPELQGEFGSARLLPSGKLVAATYSPGKWTSPHPDHRIHWYGDARGAQAPVRLASSSSLARAPARVVPMVSTGGSGTFGYESGLPDMLDGELGQLQVQQQLTLSPGITRPGEQLSGTMRLANTGERGVLLNSLSIQAIPGPDCTPDGQAAILLWEQQEVIVGPLSERLFEGSARIDARFAPGTWCAYLVLEDARGVSHVRLDISETWEVEDEGGVTGVPVIPGQDLELTTPAMAQEDDMGGELMDEPQVMAPMEADHAAEGGSCGCVSAPSPLRGPTRGGALLLLCGAWVWRRRQRME